LGYFNRPINTRAREIRQAFAHLKPRIFAILSIHDTAPAMTTITALVTYPEKGVEKTTEITVHLMYADKENMAVLRGEPNGRWLIHQRSFNPIIYPKPMGPAEDIGCPKCPYVSQCPTSAYQRHAARYRGGR
jgi:hypothetical protein